MARIPQHTLEGARHVGVQAPRGAFQHTTRSVARLAKTVNASVDQFLAEGFKAQDIRNREDIRARSAEMDMERERFMQELEQNNVDPAQWVPQWEERLKGIEEKTFEKGLPPEVVQPLKGQFDIFSKKSILSLNGAALKKNKSNAKSGFSSDFRFMMKECRFDEARQLLEANKDLYDPVQVKGMTRALDMEQRDYTMEVNRMNDPLTHQANLEENTYGLNELQLAKEKKRTQSEIMQQERLALAEVEELIDTDAFESEEELTAHLDGIEVVDDASKKLTVENWKNMQPIPDDERYAIMDAFNDSFAELQSGRISPEEYRDQWNKNSSMLSAFGKRDGAGALRSLRYQRDPIHHLEKNPETGEYMLKKQGKTGEAVKSVAEFGEDLIRVRSTGIYNKKVAGFGGDKESEPVKYARYKEKSKLWEVRLRKEMDDMFNDWLASQPEMPDNAAVEKAIAEIQVKAAKRITFDTFSVSDDELRERSTSDLNEIVK